MNLLTFSIFTIAGSALWNILLIGLGAALGTQYALIDQILPIPELRRLSRHWCSNRATHHQTRASTHPERQEQSWD